MRRISLIALETVANRVVVDNITDGVDTACIVVIARVPAFLFDTGFSRVVAIAVGHTLGRTSEVGIAKIAGQTLAGACATARIAFGVGSARVRIARFLYFVRRDEHTSGEGVTGVSLETGTNGVMAKDGAIGVFPTNTKGARILALFLEAFLGVITVAGEKEKVLHLLILV